MLSPGDRLWVKVPGSGFVGVGRAIGRAQPAATCKVATSAGDVPVLEIAKGGSYHREFLNDPERCEYFVPIRWLQTVPLEELCRRSAFLVTGTRSASPRRPDGAPRWSA